MVKYLGVFLLLLFPLLSLAQKEDRVWVFGHNAGIDFNDTANPVNFVTECKNYKTSSSIADLSGNLLFYLSCDLAQNKCSIKDKNNLNIDGLENINGIGGTGACSAIISFSDSVFYIFYVGRRPLTCSLNFCPGLFHSKIKLDANGNLVALFSDSLLTNEFAYEKFEVVKHANGTDWWLVMPALNTISGFCTNRKHVFLLQSASVQLIVSQDIGKVTCSPQKDGDMTFSPDGSKLIESYYRDSLVQLYNFDRCTGLLSNPRTVDNAGSPYFLTFSPNGKLAYVSKGKGGISTDNNLIYQYSLDSVDIPSTRTTIWEDTTEKLNAGFLKLAPDNKIYFSCAYGNSGLSPQISPYSQNLGVIHAPNEIGTASDFRPFSYYLGDSALATFGLPNMPNYNLGPLPIYQASAGVDTFYCQGDSTIKALPIGGDSLPHITYLWQPAPGIDSLNVRTQLVKPNQSRWYYVTITDTSYTGPSCNSRLDSVYVEVKLCTGITEKHAIQAKLYPNPTNGLFTIEVPTSATGYNFRLFNLLGQQMMEAKLKQEKTELQLNYPTGIYLYQITHNGQVQNGKLVIGD